MALFHISNRYFNLAPVLAAAAKTLQLQGAAHFTEKKTIADGKLPVYATLVVGLTRSTQALQPFYDKRWKPLKPVSGVHAWSDDWSDVMSALILPGQEPPLAWENAPHQTISLNTETVR